MGYEYVVYNPDGSTNGTFLLENEYDATYLGGGMFNIGKGFYCAKGGVWIEDTKTNGSLGYTVNNGELLINVVRDPEKNQLGVVVLTEMGELTTAYCPVFENNSSVRVSNIADDVCVFYSRSHDWVVSFNIYTGETNILDASYSEKIPSWAWDNDPDAPTDNRIIVPVEGADGNSYSFIFDTKFNLIAGPLLGNFGISSEGLIRATVYRDALSHEVYDMDGNFIFSVSDLNYEYKSNFACGAMLLQNGRGKNAFVDTSGNFLFENIDLDHVKKVNLT